MKRRDLLRALASLVCIGVACMSSMADAHAGQKASRERYARCAKVCADCEKTCQACVKHCNAMIAAGMKEHEKSKRLSEDTEAICATAAKICARRGPLTAEVCQACLLACKFCGAECAKYPKMKPMKDCADSCKVCAKACQEMVRVLMKE